MIQEFVAPATEEWRPVVGYEGWYEVSSHGRLKMVKGGSGTRAGRVRKHIRDQDGYDRLYLYNGSKSTRKKVFVHHLVAAAFIGPKPEGMVINHLDLDKTNNAACNLEYTTPSGNVCHAVANGAHPRGERQAHSKLREEDIPIIRQLRAEGLLLKQIAPMFGVHVTQISKVMRRATWGHVA